MYKTKNRGKSRFYTNGNKRSTFKSDRYDSPLRGTKEFEFEPPMPNKQSDDTSLIEAKAFRDLSFSGAIEVKADPNSELAKGSYPYQIIGRTNSVIDAKYPGSANISGNSITQIQNSTRSQLLNSYDIGTMTKRLNYLYVRCEGDDKDNLAYFSELIKSVQQALSYGYSTMLTQLEFYTDEVKTDYPSVSGVEDQQKDRTGALLHYQSVLQNFVAPLAKYIQTRGLEQTIMNISYRREASLITQLYGLLKKSAFISQLNSIGTSVLNEYFDDSWYKQMNTLLNISSKKTQGMVDPLITMSGAHKIVRTKFSNDNGETYYYDSDNALKVEGFTYLNPETLKYVTNGTLTLEELVANVVRLLDVYSITRWARQRNEGILTVEQPRDPSAYYEAINQYIKQIALLSASFASRMSSVRTFLDKMSQTNLIYWKRGQLISVDKIADVTPVYNKLLTDLIGASYAGSSKMTFDQSTKRWKIFTLWNKFTGISQFDKVAGGAFLTFSLRELEGNNLDYTGSEFLIPVLFSPSNTSNVNYNEVQFTNRSGITAALMSVNMTNEDVNKHPYLSRLNPLLATDLNIKVPVLRVDESTSIESATQDLINRQVSSGLLLIDTLFGYGDVKYLDKVNDTTKQITTVGADILCYIDAQIEDVSNMMIDFVRCVHSKR